MYGFAAYSELAYSELPSAAEVVEAVRRPGGWRHFPDPDRDRRRQTDEAQALYDREQAQRNEARLAREARERAERLAEEALERRLEAASEAYRRAANAAALEAMRRVALERHARARRLAEDAEAMFLLAE